MSEKNIVYYWEICGMTYEAIALQCRLTVDQVKAINPDHKLLYRIGWIDSIKGE